MLISTSWKNSVSYPNLTKSFPIKFKTFNSAFRQENQVNMRCCGAFLNDTPVFSMCLQQLLIQNR